MPILAGQFWEQIILPSRIKKDEILWSPANTGPLLVPNQVVTIHDTFIFDHPEWFQPSFRLLYRSLLPQLVKRAARIITVSNYSCNRLTDIFGLKINQVTSIPCGVDLDWFQPGSQTEIERVRQLYKIPGSYLLFIGSLEPRKNLARLVQAWKIVQKEYPHIMLVIAGGQSKRVHNSETLAESLGIKKIGYVCECDLPALYSGALGFLYPSLCEGFGLQILESMACGTPVLAANTGAFPEVVAEAGLLINPYDIEEIAYSICRMISEKDLREDLRLRGFQRARQFSWENTTNAIENVFEEVRQKITL
ncbi:MAG: glycosyltransferase family 1 protein [Anaerolineaceae bacterium]|nr:glycosyltransferase family 1 protein [Anaerolineaceae bacterium]